MPLTPGKLYRLNPDSPPFRVWFYPPESDNLFWRRIHPDDFNKLVMFTGRKAPRGYRSAWEFLGEDYYVYFIDDEVSTDRFLLTTSAPTEVYKLKRLPECFIVLAANSPSPRVIPADDGTTIKTLKRDSPTLAKKLLSGHWHF